MMQSQKNAFTCLKETDDNGYLCTECNLKIVNYTECINHINVHRLSSIPKCGSFGGDNKILSCQVCEYEVNNNRELLCHIWLKHVFTWSCNKCSICGLSFQSPTQVLQHLDVSCVYFKCKKCSQVYNEELSYYRHVLKCYDYHSEGHHTCHICEKQVLLKDVARHLLKHSLEMARIMVDHYMGATKLEDTHNKPILCEMCNTMFKKQKHWESHMHAHYKVMPYICKHCGRGYTHKTTAQVHLANFHNIPIKSDHVNPVDVLQIMSCSQCKIPGFTKKSFLVRHYVLVCEKTCEHPQRALFSIAFIKTAKKYNLSFIETLRSEHFASFLSSGIRAYSSEPVVSNFIKDIKSYEETSEDIVRLKDYTDVDLLCGNQSLCQNKNVLHQVLDGDIHCSELNPDTKLEESRLSENKLKDFPGACLLPEPDVGRLMYFSKLVKQITDTMTNTESIPEETLARLNMESQLLREMEPFYIEKNSADIYKDEVATTEVEELVNMYNDKDFLESSIENADYLLS